MRASTLCKYALAITYGVYIGKVLGGYTKAFADGLIEGLTENIKTKSE